MSRSEYLDALYAECRERPEFAHAFALIVTREDKLRLMAGVLSDRMRLALAARKKTQRANYRARDRHQAYIDAGCVRVRGALGGIYYE